jgi:hypothetical protein
MDGVEYDVRGATGNAYIRLGGKVSWEVVRWDYVDGEVRVMEGRVMPEAGMRSFV